MSSAARHLSITQSAVSQKIAALEYSLGVTLLDRTVRPMLPTAAGLIHAERAESLLSSARETVQSVRTGLRRAIPHLRLALIDSAAATMGPHLVRRVRNLAGRWSIRSGLAKRHGDALLNREVDLINTTDPLEDHGGLVRYEILEEAHVILTPTNYTGPLEPLAVLSRRLDLVRLSARSVSGQGVFAKPFVKVNKNNYRDPEASAEAVQRPAMRFVPLKRAEQLDLQSLHRVRQRPVGQRTALINQLRAILLERGITVPLSRRSLEKRLPEVLADERNGVSPRMRRLILRRRGQRHVRRSS